MPSRKKLLHSAELYVILDREVCDYSKLLTIVKRTAGHGVNIYQLRDKAGCAKEILDFSRKVKPLVKDKALYIINDRVDCAALSGADGVHLGQDDISVTDARRMLGRQAIIGQSCQNLSHICQAQKDKADYIGFGSVYRTKTKPGRSPMDSRLLQQAADAASVPLFAIGGISLSNIEDVKALKIQRVAICRAILLSKDVRKTVKEFNHKLGEI